MIILLYLPCFMTPITTLRTTITYYCFDYNGQQCGQSTRKWLHQALSRITRMWIFIWLDLGYCQYVFIIACLKFSLACMQMVLSERKKIWTNHILLPHALWDFINKIKIKIYGCNTPIVTLVPSSHPTIVSRSLVKNIHVMYHVPTNQLHSRISCLYELIPYNPYILLT